MPLPEYRAKQEGRLLWGKGEPLGLEFKHEHALKKKAVRGLKCVVRVNRMPGLL